MPLQNRRFVHRASLYHPVTWRHQPSNATANAAERTLVLPRLLSAHSTPAGCAGAATRVGSMPPRQPSPAAAAARPRATSSYEANCFLCHGAPSISGHAWIVIHRMFALPAKAPASAACPAATAARIRARAVAAQPATLPSRPVCLTFLYTHTNVLRSACCGGRVQHITLVQQRADRRWSSELVLKSIMWIGLPREAALSGRNSGAQKPLGYPINQAQCSAGRNRKNRQKGCPEMCRRSREIKPTPLKAWLCVAKTEKNRQGMKQNRCCTRAAGGQVHEQAGCRVSSPAKQRK